MNIQMLNVRIIVYASCLWYGKTRVTSYELRVTSLKLKSTSWKLKEHELKFKSASSNPRVTSSNSWVTGSNLWVTSSNPQVTSSNPRIIKSMKAEISSLKSCPFLKIVSTKSFGNSWGNSYVQVLLLISCFVFPPHHGYGFSKKLSE